MMADLKNRELYHILEKVSIILFANFLLIQLKSLNIIILINKGNHSLAGKEKCQKNLCFMIFVMP